MRGAPVKALKGTVRGHILLFSELRVLILANSCVPQYNVADSLATGPTRAFFTCKSTVSKTALDTSPPVNTDQINCYLTCTCAPTAHCHSITN